MKPKEWESMERLPQIHQENLSGQQNIANGLLAHSSNQKFWEARQARQHNWEYATGQVKVRKIEFDFPSCN